MIFTSPIWLIGLLPWAAVTLWLLWGRPIQHRVPFVRLWRGAAVHKRAARSVRLPPPGLALMLLAMLMALLAAAQPAIRTRGGVELTVLVDRGLTMSARSKAQTRYLEAAATLAASLRDGPPRRVIVVDIIGGARWDSDSDHWLGVVDPMPRTAIDTTSLVRTAVLGELSRSAGPIMLLSDHAIGLDDPRLRQVSPASPLRDVGITAIAARESPSAQVMVTVRNNSELAAVELRISSNGREVLRHLVLPAAGQETRSFVDFPGFGDLIEAKLDVADDLEADDTAWLCREARPPRLETRAAVPEALRRMIDVYAKARPSDDRSEVVAIVNRAVDLRAGDAGAIVETPTSPMPAGREILAVDHPVTAVVDWRKAAAAAIASAGPPQGFQALVTSGGRVLVAVREEPARQAWVGFDSAHWPRSADFVVFWTNVFDWIGGSGRAFTAHPLQLMNDDWKRQGPPPTNAQPRAWPGVFKRADGATRAMNAPAAAVSTPVGGLSDRGDRERFGNLEQKRDIGKWLLLGAILFVVAASTVWRSDG